MITVDKVVLRGHVFLVIRSAKEKAEVKKKFHTGVATWNAGEAKIKFSVKIFPVSEEIQLIFFFEIISQKIVTVAYL